MLLNEELSEYTKDELLDQARSFELRGCSGLRKAELIDKIVAEFCTEEMMRSRMACLTQEQMNLFRKACVSPATVGIDEAVDGIQLCHYWLGSFGDPSDRFCVFEDVKEIFTKIDDAEFRAENQRKGWMMKCIQFFAAYYGIAPLEVIHKMYCQKIRISMKDLKNMLDDLPVDIIESAVFSMEKLGMSDWASTTPLYSSYGLLVHLPLFEQDEQGKDELQYLINQQMDKEFFIPSVSQIDEICRLGLEESSLAYKNLKSFFIKKMRLPYEQAVTWCSQIWANSYEGNMPSDIFHRMSDAKISFDSDKQINEFMMLLSNAHNATRLKENRGHRPDELRAKAFSNGIPTIVPGSSQAAKILSEAAPQLQAMGIPLDINGGADTIQTTVFPSGMGGPAVQMEKKIYPNDPCPCGSGKKYKKCCGKNK